MIVGVTQVEKLEKRKKRSTPSRKLSLDMTPKNGSTQRRRSEMRNITKSST